MNDRLRIGILGGGGILGAQAPGFVDNAADCSVVMVAEPNRHMAVRDPAGALDLREIDDLHI